MGGGWGGMGGEEEACEDPPKNNVGFGGLMCSRSIFNASALVAAALERLLGFNCSRRDADQLRAQSDLRE